MRFMSATNALFLASCSGTSAASARARLRGAVAGELQRRSRREGWAVNGMALGFAAVAVLVAIWGTWTISTSEGVLPHGLSRLDSSR